jgi:hypothetical protein
MAMTFWNVVWFIVISFVFVAYLMILFNIVGDLFRDHELSGWAKAVWMVALIFFPILTAVVYLVARGDGMSSRDYPEARAAESQQAQYGRSVAVTSPTEEISRARSMLDAGVLDKAEYDAIKLKVLA